MAANRTPAGLLAFSAIVLAAGGEALALAHIAGALGALRTRRDISV